MPDPYVLPADTRLHCIALEEIKTWMAFSRSADEKNDLISINLSQLVKAGLHHLTLASKDNSESIITPRFMGLIFTINR